MKKTKTCSVALAKAAMVLIPKSRVQRVRYRKHLPWPLNLFKGKRHSLSEVFIAFAVEFRMDLANNKNISTRETQIQLHINYKKSDASIESFLEAALHSNKM